ncbi:MAG: hypothetical protein HYZ44_03615 [Bacteroidetes bacterium]|nr:hypothetical protein [Bacteroidota bacterium]
MYLLESKIESLSARIKAFRSESTHKDYVDTNIKEDNLIYNISHTIAKAILAVGIPEKPTLASFNNKVGEFNRLYRTSITAEWFLSNQWIRIINNKIIFPSSVARVIGSTEEDIIPAELVNHVRFLRELHAESIGDSFMFDVNALLAKLTNEEIKLLVDINILHKNSDDKYNWNKSEYTRHLRNEICSSLWILVCDNILFADFDERIRYCAEIIQFYQIAYPDQLSNFLKSDELEKIHDAALSVLFSENDLVDTGNEFKKSWLDGPRYERKSLFNSIPSITLSKESTIKLLEEIDSLDKWFQGEIEFDESRRFYDILLILMIQTELQGQSLDKSYLGVKTILSDLSRPYLVRQLIFYIQRDYQFVIPVLLNSSKLAPIVFKLTNEIDINEKLLVKTVENETVHQIRSASYKLKSELWIDAFETFLLKLSTNHNHDSDTIQALFQILWSQAKLHFKRPTNYDHEIHSEERKRFEIATKKLSEIRLQGNYHGGVKPRIFPRIIGELFQILQKQNEVTHYQFIEFNQPAFKFAIYLLKLCNTPLLKSEIPKNDSNSLKLLSDEVAAYLLELVQKYYTCEEIQVLDFNTGLTEMKKPQWGSHPFGFELLEWGLFFSHIHNIGQLSKFEKTIESQFRFEKNHQEGRYHDQNTDIYEKARLYLKSIACAVIQIKESPATYEVLSSNINELTDTLFNLLEKYSLRFSVDDIKKDRINAFDERFHLTHDLHYLSVLTVVFKAMNHQTEELKAEFVRQYIQEDKHLLRLLGIVNLIEGHSSKKILFDELKNSSIEEFILASRVTTEWREAMIEAINTDDFFEFARPLSERLEAHLKKVGHLHENDSHLLFEVKLLYAFKTKNLDDLNNIVVPASRNLKWPAQELKRFFIGMHKLYNSSEYDKALNIFEELHSNDTSNAEYAYRLFHTRTVKAKTNMDSAEMKLAMDQWKAFTKNAPDKAKRTMQSLDHNIRYTSIFYYEHFEEFSNLDTSLENLPLAYLYDSEIAPSIFNTYLKRNLDELAYNYLSQARRYYVDNGLLVPKMIEYLYSTIDDTKYINRLKASFLEIQTLPPDKFIKTVPRSLNNGNTVEEFILNEIVRAGKILMEKVRALDKVPIENKYNDLLQSILRFRFPVWGWTISDQGRTGASDSGGDDLGSSDFIVQCANESIALIEAMIIEGKNKSKTSEHVAKCNKYVSHTTRFYLVSYYKGRSEKFIKTWESYKNDVLAITFDDSFKLLKNEFHDITSVFIGTRNIRVGKTLHCDGITFFHIFFNIS